MNLLGSLVKVDLPWVPLLIGLFVGLGLAGGVQQYRIKSLQTEFAQVQRTYAEASAHAISEALGRTTKWQTGVDDALDKLRTTAEANRAAQAALDASLRGLDNTTGRLRSDLADVPARIAGASESAVAEFAATCKAVLTAMADAGGSMARDGGRIASAADQHAADAVMLHDAWPQ